MQLTPKMRKKKTEKRRRRGERSEYKMAVVVVVVVVVGVVVVIVHGNCCGEYLHLLHPSHNKLNHLESKEHSFQFHHNNPERRKK